jgi:hypothetical protein
MADRYEEMAATPGFIICPDCNGCGYISRGLFGEPVSQPTWASNNSQDTPERCPRCNPALGQEQG